MKRIIVAILCMAGMIVAAGCDSLIVDWTPVDIYIEAWDDSGRCIISPEMPGMSLTFKGETYTVQENPVRTRAYAAILVGLIAQPYSDGEQERYYRLYFGEIDGAADMDEDIVLNWPDGSEDVIHYHCSNHREWPKPDCNRSWKLNGARHEGSTFRFTGKSLPEQS